MSSDQVLMLPAMEIASMVQSREISAIQLTEMSLDRIKEHDGQIDERIASGEYLPLAGLALVVKDHIWLAGAPATNGSRALADFVPGEDSMAVSRLLDAGAIVVGKTNNPEFCYRGDTYSPMYGPPRANCGGPFNSNNVCGCPPDQLPIRGKGSAGCVAAPSTSTWTHLGFEQFFVAVLSNCSGSGGMPVVQRICCQTSTCEENRHPTETHIFTPYQLATRIA